MPAFASRFALALILVGALASAQTVVEGAATAIAGNSLSLSGAMLASPGTQPAADPCQVPQFLLDALGTFGSVLNSGSPQNAPVRPVPGTTPDDAVAGVRFLLANSWYQVCEIHQLEKEVSQLQTQTGALQQITNIQAGASSGTATVTFTTSLPSLGWVQFGWASYGPYNSTPLETTATTTHSISFATMGTNQAYVYYVCAEDANFNIKCSPPPGIQALTFTAP